MGPEGLTIAIPNWNHELLLPRSIRSALSAVRILRQQGVPAEILVVDDASRDGSLTLLRQLEALYYEEGLHVLSLHQNRGVTGARNLALEQAEYRYVLFMDADNELVAENCPSFYRALRETQAAAVYGNLIVLGRPEGTTVLSNESFQDRIFEDNYVDTFALIDRVQILDAGGYTADGRVRAFGDWDFFLNLAVKGRRLVFVPMVLGIYFSLAGSMLAAAARTGEEEKAHLRRVYDQLGLRKHTPLRTRHLRYHPDIGYI
jgi:glycosyltransferase involved in cell wall biosynthesis